MSTNELTNQSDDDSCESDIDVAFASIDFTGVKFESTEPQNQVSINEEIESFVVSWERRCVFGEYDTSKFPDQQNSNDDESSLQRLQNLGVLLASGKYTDILRSSDTAIQFFNEIDAKHTILNNENTLSIHDSIRDRVLTMGNESNSVITLVELEALGIAALNLFLQSNYTGPSLLHDDDTTNENTKSILDGINPHQCFSHFNVKEFVSKEETKIVDHVNDDAKRDNNTLAKNSSSYQNSILSELAVDGQWPCQVCYVPYFLVLARSILLTLADPLRLDWTYSHGIRDGILNSKTAFLDRVKPSSQFISNAAKLEGIYLWNARSVVAHERLIQSREPSITLWNEVELMFRNSIGTYCPDFESMVEPKQDKNAAIVMIEWGLAEHHFDRPGKGRKSFDKAVQYSGLNFEVTGAIGKRTKFQYKATAQFLVKAKSAKDPDNQILSDVVEKDKLETQFRGQMIEHSEEEILLERIAYDDEKENGIDNLSILDQSILLALCLDVKNTNPVDGLTNEEMAAFLSRVLDHHDDWMIYSTGLLERAWVEFERLHARERAILQIQALVDQHTNRLTLTQSTRKSIEESAPVQDRLRNIHTMVYPPRWSMIEDLADRYASMGIVTSAAELYLEIELWDYVVECYKRGGRIAQAEKIVLERLALEETPRMWSALGDLTNDPKHYEKAIELSKGRFSNAYLSLGSYYFDKGEMENAAENYEKAVKVRPLARDAWFRLGTICMQLRRWEEALQSFSEVVMQEPEEADAWANIAAIHMHNKMPAEAYPALVESLKHKRSSWRVWLNKLYICLDLSKYDEAVQACNTLLDLRASNKARDGIPPLEEKCVRGIVGGTLKNFNDNRSNVIAFDSARRSLTRVHALLDRISSSSDAEAWVFETMAHFHEQTGNFKELIEDLMKEYRSLQAIPGWEKDDHLVKKVQAVVSQIVHLHQNDETKESLIKCSYLVRGVTQKIELARGIVDNKELPEEVEKLKKMLSDLEISIKSYSDNVEKDDADTK